MTFELRQDPNNRRAGYSAVPIPPIPNCWNGEFVGPHDTNASKPNFKCFGATLAAFNLRPKIFGWRIPPLAKSLRCRAPPCTHPTLALITRGEFQVYFLGRSNERLILFVSARRAEKIVSFNASRMTNGSLRLSSAVRLLLPRLCCERHLDPHRNWSAGQLVLPSLAIQPSANLQFSRASIAPHYQCAVHQSAPPLTKTRRRAIAGQRVFEPFLLCN